MPIVIQPYCPEHEPAVADFNLRLRQAGEDENLFFYRYAEPRWLPRTANSRLYTELFVAIDNGVVRGGYALKTQDLLFPDGHVRSIALFNEHRAQRRDNYDRIWRLLNLEVWQRVGLEGEAHSEVGEAGRTVASSQ